MARPRKSEEWTTESERALISFMRERPFMWNQNHYDFHYIETKRKVFMECAAMLGPPFTWERVRDRWTNMRTTFACNYKRTMIKTENEVQSPKPTWVYYNDLIFLEPIVAARYAAKSQANNNETEAPLVLKTEEEDIPCSPPEYYDYESNSMNTEEYSRPVEAMEETKTEQKSFVAIEEDEWDDFGKMVAKILRKMSEGEARAIQLEFFKILALKSKGCS